MARAHIVRRSTAWILSVGFTLLAAPVASQAALALASGGSGTSANLSSNPTIRKHQLLCDPLNPAGGSYSVSYDPNVVSYDFGSLESVPGYTITSAFISRNFGTVTSPNPVLVDINNSSSSNMPETGYIQVFFQQDPATPYQPPGLGRGYIAIDSAGVKGSETHGISFSYLPNVLDTTVTSYTVFADPGGRFMGSDISSPADFLTDPDGKTIPYNEIAPSTVRGNLFVPEPGTLGLLALAAAGLLSAPAALTCPVRPVRPVRPVAAEPPRSRPRATPELIRQESAPSLRHGKRAPVPVHCLADAWATGPSTSPAKSGWDVWSWVCILASLVLVSYAVFGQPLANARRGVGFPRPDRARASPGTLAVLALPPLRTRDVGMVWTFAPAGDPLGHVLPQPARPAGAWTDGRAAGDAGAGAGWRWCRCCSSRC